jgi:hypothetical protein
MAGYLEGYGTGDEQRARNIKIIVVSVVCLLVASGLGYFVLHNRSQEQRVKQFFQLLAAQDYQGAYTLWGCTDARPCSGYPMSAFLRDWGPPVAVNGFSVLDGESCGNSVIVDVDAGAAGDRKVWVNRDTLEMSFPPYETGCPQRNRIYDWVREVKYKMHGRVYQ